MTSTATGVRQWHDVRVTFDDGGVHLDAIQGLDEEDARRNAEENWPGAEVEYLKVRDFQQQDEAPMSPNEQGSSDMSRADHKVEIKTADGNTHTKRVTKEESRYYDDLPFTSSNVASTRITTK